VRFSPEHRVYGLGVILLVSLAIASQKFSSARDPSFLALVCLAGIAYLLAIREFFATPIFPKRVVVIGLVLAAAWQVPFLLKPAGLDDDVHRYVWDGRLQRLGYNPYIVIPSDPASSRLHTPETITLNNPEVASPYPPGAELFFRAVTWVSESTFALKVAFVICDIAIVFVLLDILRRSGQERHWVLAYAWHPLLATEVAASGHVDILGALLLLVSAWALARHWRPVAAVAFGLAVSLKFLPIVLAPLYWKRIRVRDAALAAIVVALLYVPFLDRGRIPLGSLGTYIQRFRFNDPVFASLERFAPPQLVALVATVLGFFVAAWMRKKSEGLTPDSFAWPMAASLFCAPVVYPWYLLWLLPFLRSVSTVPLMLWTISIIPTYDVWHLRELGRPWSVPEWILLLEYGSVALAAAFLASRHFRRPAAS
jgi:alpha-1,6-mannosyltransferase